MMAPSDSAGVAPALVEAAIAAIDARVSRQLDEILHHPRFQALERAWRGLWFLVERTDFAENIRILILDWSKDDLHADLSGPGGIETSLLFDIAYAAEQRRADGAPYAAILADFAFAPEPGDLDLLRRAGGVAWAALAPFIAAADRTFLDGSPRDARDLAELRAAHEASRPAWLAFRKANDALFVGLVLPRFLLREPHRAAATASFAYDERVNEPEAHCWGRATYAFATRLVESFAKYRWCPNIIGPGAGGDVDRLPLHPCPVGEGRGGQIPTEVPLSDRQAFAFAEDGLIPLTCGREGLGACFFDAPSAKWPEKFPGTEEGRAAELNHRLLLTLPYLFIVTRVMHYLRVVYRLNHARWGDRHKVERELNDWVGQYVSDSHVLTFHSRQPLRTARVSLRDTTHPDGWRLIDVGIKPQFKYSGVFFRLSLCGHVGP